jgi:hypothetical protein
MFWRHIYIPVLPIQLIDFVCAPMPFLVGVHSSYLPDEIMLDQVTTIRTSIIVDLLALFCDQPGHACFVRVNAHHCNHI